MYFKISVLILFLSIIFLTKGNFTTPNSSIIDENDDDWSDEEDDLTSSEVEDESNKIYKNPRNSPSTLCPRDEEQATLLGQKCLRKCSSDEDCKSKKKKCLCDGACGMSCIKPDRECPEPTTIQLGTVSASGYLFGARATYSCEHGYHVVGLQSRTCQGDGLWAGQAPACKQNIYCLSPPTIDHARHNALSEQSTFDLDSTLQYFCHTGYVTNGFPRAKCLAIDGQASWYGPDISCEPRSCGPPAELSHGWHAGECYTFGCRLTYHCAEGYELVGKSERQCQSDGTWSPKELPTCVLITAVQCSPPENPRHGKAIYTSCSYNSVVRYECYYGYTLVGESTRRCGADRKWSGSQPVCKEINCGHPGRLWNGWLENIESGTGLGASIIFRCHEGMFLDGNSSTVCQIDGKWRYPLPRCLAPCVVPHILKGRVILLSRNDTAPTSTVVTHGEVLTVDCDPKYEFFSNYANVTCDNGTWTQMPKCEPARCRRLPKPPRHGMVSAPDMKHGMKAKFRCKDGYKPVGNIFMECQFGNWTGTLPRCKQVYCAYPGPLPNGNILLVGNMGLYDYRPYVKKINNNKQIMYDCNKGFVLTVGAAGATCVGGKWSPVELPKCLPAEHPRFRFNRRRRAALRKCLMKSRINKKRRFSLYEQIFYPGLNRSNIYKTFMDDNNELKLFNCGKLNKEHKMKRYVKRESSNSLNNFKITKNRIIANRKKFLRFKRALKGSGAVGASVHKSSGSQKTSSRRGHKTSKNNEDEDDLPSIDNHQVSIKKNKTRGGPCDSLQDEPFVNIEIIKHGKYPNSTYSTGTVVRLACGKGYVLNIADNKTAKCVKGTWKPIKPECHIVPCYVPETPFGIYKLHKFENGSNIDLETIVNSTSPVPNGFIVEFSCEEGYNAEGSTNMRCWHGDWAVTMFPECSPAPCLLPKIHNGQYMSGYRAGLTIANGSSISFQCDEGFHPISVQLLICSLGELYPQDFYCLKEGQAMPETHYMGGKDIVKGGDITVIEYGSSTGKPCGPPARTRGSLIYKNGEQLIDDDNNFPEGSEVTFNCIESIVGERTTWKIVCENGGWIGKSLTCEADEFMQHQTIANNSTCVFRNQEPNVISFYNDQKIKEEVIEFPTGAVLVSRCIDIGKYAMIGPNRRRCMGGEWDGPKPVCYGLNQENDYSMEKPPTILFRHNLGPIAQSNDGKLIVYPGTTLHMECLWIRRFGIPKWNISHNYRTYPEGWTTDPGRDSQLEYRLSIIHATKDDSGLFTCVTPARYTHSVEIVVTAIHCPGLPQRRGLKANTQNTKMNSHIKFYCVNGNSLIGASEVICLPSGNWSAPFPVCESVECGEVGPNLSEHLKVVVVSREVGGRAVFSCDSGFSLKGAGETMCQATGDWATPFPTCEEVYCDEPLSPVNGFIQGNGPYKAGDVIQFNCNPDYMMEGQPIIACQDNGKWSGKIPKCVQACSYPGTTISGRMSNVKFYYTIGENITFSCEPGLRLRGASILICLKNGKWSNAIPTCNMDDRL